jgi:hypothetical protein
MYDFGSVQTIQKAKISDMERRKPDTDIAYDVVGLRTRMSSNTQIEYLDMFCRFIRKQLQTTWSLPGVLSRLSDGTLLPHTRMFSEQYDAVHSPAEYLFRAGDLHLKVSCTES